MSYRKQIYNNILKTHHDKIENISFEEFCRDVFYYPIGNQKRLRHYGYRLLKTIYTSYEVSWGKAQLPSDISSKHVLWLARNCKHLYYVGSNSIVLFDKDEAILFKMCDANLEIISEY